jgi:UDP-glucose 4-epimerase
MKNILVIGGAGFIGSHLCEHLVKSGHIVVSLDNYSTGSESNHIQGVEYICGEAKNVGYLCRSFDLIYHLGEYSRVEQSYTELNKVLDYNVYSIAPVVEFAKKCNAKLVYSGSSTKYTSQGAALSPYTWSKVTNIDFIKNYAEWYGLDYAIAYFYNVYGPREISSGKYSTVVAKFLHLAKSGATKLPVTSPGTQLRNFTHIDDIVAGLILVGEQASGDDWGIGSPDAHSVLDLADMIGLPPKMLPATKGNRLSASVVTEKIQSLGWSAKNNLRNYVKSQIKSV